MPGGAWVCIFVLACMSVYVCMRGCLCVLCDLIVFAVCANDLLCFLDALPVTASAAFSRVEVAINTLADAALQCVCKTHEAEVEEVSIWIGERP